MVASTKECFECWFLDVGQGASNIIYLGDGQAIVIDCGPGYSKQALEFLARYVNKIKALIFSHNDSDHINGASGVLASFSELIDEIYFLNDGKYEKVLAFLERYDPENRIDKYRPEYGKHGIILDENGVKVEVIYPDLICNLQAEKAGNRRANQTSTIIKLTFGKKCIIFASDATIEAWEYLSDNYFSQKPFECDVMTVPHHGGKITSGSEESKIQKRLYSKIIKPQFGIISVGTSNGHNHPCSETIYAMVESGIEVLCTQMTSQCCCELEKIRGVTRIITQPSLSSREKKTTVSGYSKNVACLGTITTEVSPEEIKINQLGTHRRNKKLFSNISTFDSLCGDHYNREVEK